MSRITIICGHYGSGKTSIAVSYAKSLAAAGQRVCIADMDIVNPYFRTKDAKEELAEAGVRLIVSDYANTNVDMPAMPSDLYSIFTYPEEKVIIDLGGDDRGALALGRFREGILEGNDWEMLFVINTYRPLTQTTEDCTEVMHEVELSAGMRVTGIINNSNLGEETDEEVILSGARFAEEFCKSVNLPLVMNCVTEQYYQSLKDKVAKPFPVTRR